MAHDTAADGRLRRRVLRRRVRLGPVLVAGHRVVVRGTRWSDFERWREIRLRDRALIEPFWTTSALSWEERHTRAWWIRERLRQRRARFAGRALPLSIVVDGEFAGQCNLDPIDRRHRTAELGIWIDSRWARHGAGAIAGAMVADHVFGPLGLHRICAPVCTGNRPARHSSVRAGMFLEATMIRAHSVGGRRRDHELWAVTAESMPAGGYVTALIAAGVRAEKLPRTAAFRHRHPAGRPTGAPALMPADVLTVARYCLGAPLRHYGNALRHGGASGDPAAPPTTIEGHDADDRPIALHKCGHLGRFGSSRQVAYEVAAAGRPIGRIDLDLGGRNAGLTLGLDPDAATAGAAAVSLLLERLFGDLGCERLEALIDPGDEQVAAVATAAGLRREGRLTGARLGPDGRFRDVELWAATIEK